MLANPMLKGIDLPRVGTGGFGFGGRSVSEPQDVTGGLGWREWVSRTFPSYATAPFAEHHEIHWEWVWSLESGVRPPALLDFWGRGGAKSTTAEMSCVAVGARAVRKYGLYLCSTQDQANDHVQNVEGMLDQPALEGTPLAQRKLNKHGYSAGWKRNRLRTEAGFTLDAVGLDKGFRGLKLEENRPDFLVIDDIDEEADTLATTLKKIAALTKKVLPAGSSDLAVLFAQNLVIVDGVASRLAGVSEYEADFLKDRYLNGPVPAVANMEYEERDNRIHITSGTASWEGQDLKTCEEQVAAWGLEAFLSEAQHEVSVPVGTLVYRLFQSALDRGKDVQPNRQSEQFLGIDPGYSKRAAMLAVQERGDNVEMWKEWSFHRCEDDHVARVAAEHCLEWDVRTVFHDAESPELGAAIRKHLNLLYEPLNRKPPRVDSVAFGKYKRLAIKATRWLLQMGAVAWGAETTEYHEPVGDDYKVSEVPGVFRSEVRKYQLVPGKDDEAQKTDDHGPDAFHSFMARWVPEYLKHAEKED